MGRRAIARRGGRPLAGLLTLLLLAVTPATAGQASEPRLRPGMAHRGVAVVSSAIGHETPVEEIAAFVAACRIDFLVVDFGWITYHFGRTDMAAVEALSRELQSTGVVVAAMYRPRALSPGEADVHFARDDQGAIGADHNELCFAHEDSIEWGASWGNRILESLPSIDHILLYNVRATCRCDRCAAGKGKEHAAAFVRGCRERWRAVEPRVRVGHVGMGLEYAEHLDFLCPFVSVNRKTVEEALDTDAAVAAAAALRRRVRDRPFVPLVKTCFASATQNTTADITGLIKSLEQRDLGFLLWYYGWIFHPEDTRYDVRSVVSALDGDWDRVAPFLARDPVAEKSEPAPRPAADAACWVYFDSREKPSGPVLVLTRSNGSVEERVVAADTVLISYLADRPMGLLERLSVSLGDTNRVLLRFGTEGLRTVKRAQIRLRVHPSQIPPATAFEMAALRVTEPWEESRVTWDCQPAAETEPVTSVEVPPGEGDVVLDVTPLVNAWIRGTRPNHGLLLKVAYPVSGAAPASPPRAPDRPWTQPPIHTGTPFSATIPWADSVEEALERARRQRKPVLVTVVPVEDRRWCSGYEAAPAEWAGSTAHPWGDARGMAIDAGLVKERVMMAALFTDPEIVHLVKSHFVPVRLRLYTLRFDPGGAQGTPDPLRQVGTSAAEVGGPALVFARPDGRLLHACRRMGVFSAPMTRALLKAVLARAGVRNVEPFETESHPALTAAWEAARAGRFADALGCLEQWQPAAESPLEWERAYLMGHLADRLGDPERARAAWEVAVAGDPRGPWGSKSAVRLEPREMRLDEWETFSDFPFDPLAQGTEVAARRDQLDVVIERAVDYLLLQQRPNGSWQDPFVDVAPGSGPGSPWDKAVPRTGLVVDALLRVRDRLPGRRAEIDRAIEQGITFVGDFADAPQPHVWKLTYALHLQVSLLESGNGPALARERAERLVAALGTVQHEGGWSYMSPPRIHSFNTAPVLLLLSQLRDLGVDVPAGMADAAATFLEGLRDREEPRKFYYASTVRHDAIRSSSCRTALCELALLEHAGGRNVARLRAGVKLFFEHEAAVRRTTKVYESRFSPAAMHDAYHYYFGHYYTARALALLPDREARAYARQQIEILLGQVELDGAFVDAQMQGKSYSAAMALLTLLEDLRYSQP